MTDLVDKPRGFMQAAARSTTLYELSAEWTELLDTLEDPEADRQEVERLLAVKAGAIKEKAESIAGLIRQCEGLAEMRKLEAKRMADAAKRFEDKAKWLRGYLLTHIELLAFPRIETGRFSISVKQNPPHVEVLDETLVPQQFKHIEIVIDKRVILDHFKKTGELPPGVEIKRDNKLEIR
jgi:Siphovirus Gp157